MVIMLKILFDALNKKFIFADGAKTFKSDFVESNGWRCEIRYDGSIQCKCIEMKHGRYLKTILNINERGWLTLSQVKDGVNYNRRRYLIKNWPVDGQLVLEDGVSEERNAIFYEMQHFSEKWKKKYGISETKFDDPNGIYFLEFYYSEEENQLSIEHIETDGKVELLDEDFGVTLNWQETHPDSSSFEHYKKIRVTDANWTIITKISTKESSRILYTLKAVAFLKNLPEGPKNSI